MTSSSFGTAAANAWDCDLLVVGSGAGALSTAVTAAHLGLKVIVVEKDHTTAAPPLGRGVDVDSTQPICHPSGYHRTD